MEFSWFLMIVLKQEANYDGQTEMFLISRYKLVVNIVQVEKKIIL